MRRAHPRARRFLSSDAGLTASEYAIVLALIVITAAGAILLLGSSAEWIMGSLGEELGGVVNLSDHGSNRFSVSDGQPADGRMGIDDATQDRFLFWKKPDPQGDEAEPR